jgi:large subunit ribosomal protein L31e
MADKSKSKEEKIVLERVYNAPLRREWLKVPRYRRAKKALNALRQFVSKHMKSENVKIGTYANLKIWEHGIKNPPHHIKVKCIKYEDGKVVAELDIVPKAKVPAVLLKARAKLEKKPKKEKAKEETPLEKLEEKEKEIRADNAEKAKEVQAEEIKEMKKESQAPKPRGHEAFAKEQKQFEKPDYLKSPKSSQKMASGEHKKNA